MTLLVVGLLLQVAQAGPRQVAPTLAFPEAGLDDTAAYQGYTTRLYRDSKGNTVQVYLEPTGGRVVQVWADAADESVGFTVRREGGRPAPMAWGPGGAEVADSGGARTMGYRLTSPAPRIVLGWFLLGSMRVERDFVYQRLNLRPFAAPPYHVAEESLLVANVARLPGEERVRHLALLRASGLAELRSRLLPSVAFSDSDSGWTIRVRRPSLDGRNYLLLELRGDPRETVPWIGSRAVSIRSRSGGPVRLAVRVTTDAAPLTPLTRDQIFNPAFFDFLAKARASGARASGAPPADSAGGTRYRRLEREVRSVELLASAEKLMAGLPNFATYFGRDMMMTALMMRPIWTPAMAEHVIASVLRKLSPRGEVSHEEALGGQAIRENAAEYNGLLAGYFRPAPAGPRLSADSVLARARAVLAELQRPRENYLMLDDEFQLPVLEARYLADPAVPAARKRAFLLERSTGGATRLALILREMALVAAETRQYARDPRPANLVGFVKRDCCHWRSASWRDSDAGYANGRFAMDINAIWAPRALEATAAILAGLPSIGFTARAIESIAPEIAGTPLAGYLADSASLRRAIETWRGARRHFEVTLGRAEIELGLRAKLAWLPAAECAYWEKMLAGAGAARDSLAFLALALDSAGRPIPVINSDPAADLLLGPEPDLLSPALEPFLRLYPIGLLVEGLGPVVANDTYAPRRVWEQFRQDAYHSPRVVWGREVNLLLLGLAGRIAPAYGRSGRLRDPALQPRVRKLREALRRTLAAVNASGLEHNELWSYRIAGGRLRPTRYGTGSDVQLWSTTDLAVQFLLARLPGP